MDFFAKMATMALAIMIPVLLIGIAIAVLMIVSYWKIFKKAGKEGWEALIPGYNIATLSSIAGFTPYLGFIVLGLFIPVISSLAYLALFVLHVVNCLKIAEAFGKDIGFAIGMMLLPFVFFPMLAFDQEAKYNMDYMYKGVGFSNYTNGNNSANNNNTFYAENLNNNEQDQQNATQNNQTQNGFTDNSNNVNPTQSSFVDNSNDVNPVQNNYSNDTNVNPIQNSDDNNNANGQW